jgi:transcription antitermination protein NusB
VADVSRSRCRELALQVLYQADLLGHREGEVARFWRHFHRGEQAPAYLQNLVDGVADHQEELDSLIKKYSEHWRLDRMVAVDRNLLRLGAYELLYHPEIPAKVVLNEAVELAKRYGTELSGAFVNGVLDQIRQAVGRKIDESEAVN